MKKRIFLSLIMFSFLAILGCKKDSIKSNCTRLKEEITANNVAEVKSLIETFIQKLPSNTYNQQNLQALTQSINNNCGISSQLLCFDCIRTLPSQSEIRLIVDSTNLQIAKTIDISYTAENKMKFVNMHD